MDGSGNLGKILRSLFEETVLIGAKTTAAIDLTSPPLLPFPPPPPALPLEALQNYFLDKGLGSTVALENLIWKHH